MVDGRSLIDPLRNPDGSLDHTALREILPYGEDFLFVDRVSRLTPEEVEASFHIPDRAPYLDSHFVDLPLMPGALIGEGLAQAGSVIVRYNLPSPEDRHVLALQIESARFLAPAQPGQTLHYCVRLKAMDRRAARLEGEARIDERKVCQARLVVAIVGREDLRARLRES